MYSKLKSGEFDSKWVPQATLDQDEALSIQIRTMNHNKTTASLHVRKPAQPLYSTCSSNYSRHKYQEIVEELSLIAQDIE